MPPLECTVIYIEITWFVSLNFDCEKTDTIILIIFLSRNIIFLVCEKTYKIILIIFLSRNIIFSVLAKRDWEDDCKF